MVGFHGYDVLEKADYKDRKKMSGCQGLGVGEVVERHRGIFKRWDHSAWH